MRIIIDTNIYIFISAALFPNGRASDADLFLTGDKDFLESSIKDPRIISVADFLAL